MFARSALRLLVPEGEVRIDAARCVRRRLANSSCSACATACPQEAITFGNDPLLDPSRCTACRRCEAACPAGAIEGDSRDVAVLAAELAKHAVPVLGCRAPGVQASAHTGCLGFLEIEAVTALSWAVPQGVTLNVTRCRECRNGSIVAKLHAVLEQAIRLPGARGRGRVRLATKRDEVDVVEPSLSRRGFFTAVGARCAKAAASIAPAVADAGTPRFSGRYKSLPSHRRFLLRAMSTVSTQTRTTLERALFPGLAFGPTCTQCTGCDGMCPTGAISTSRDDPPRAVFHPSLCTSCGVCAQFCPEHAISLSAAPPGRAALLSVSAS